MSLAKLYAKLPASMIRRRQRTVITQLNISTPNLRKLLASDLDRELKCKLYSILLYRRHQSRRRLHAS